jgi:hypothetical protein
MSAASTREKDLRFIPWIKNLRSWATSSLDTKDQQLSVNHSKADMHCTPGTLWQGTHRAKLHYPFGRQVYRERKLSRLRLQLQSLTNYK